MSTTLNAPAPSDVCSDRAATRVSILGTVMRYEWRLLRSDLSWWLAIGLALACVTYALVGGRKRIDERARSIAAAGQDETRRHATLVRQLQKIERNEAKPPDAPYRDPGNAIYVGRTQAATVAYLPDAPLASAAVGLSDLYPDVFKVGAGSKDSFLFVDEIANPTHLLTGSFDLAFVLVYLYPLLLLALCYNILSGEQEQGTLALTSASSAPLTTVLAGKLLVRAGGLVLAVVVGCWGLLLGMGKPAGTLGGITALGALSVVIVLYGLFWVALALLVNSLRRDSAFNAVALVMTWVLLLLVAPAALNATAQVLYPAPPRSETVLAVRGAAIDAERDREATETRFRDEHRTASDPALAPPPSASPVPSRAGGRRIVDEASKHTLAVLVAADARADAVLAAQEAQVHAQRRLSDRLSFLVPPLLVNDAIVELAGSGSTRWDEYLARIGAFHRRWQSFFVARARAGVALTTADYRLFPRFDPSAARLDWLEVSLLRVSLALGWVSAVTVALLIWAQRRLSRAG